MINSFTSVKHHDFSFSLYLYLNLIEVASFHFDNFNQIEIDYFEDENKHYLTTSKHGMVYIPLDWNTSKALFDFLSDSPADFSRFEYSKKLVSE